MWRTTGDVKWRERGYKMFQAIEKHTRTKFGYTTVSGIDGYIRHLDDMPRYIIYYIFSLLVNLFLSCTVGF